MSVSGGGLSSDVGGEFLSATVAVGGAVALSTGAAKDVTTLSLTAGDWDLGGAVDFVLTGTTSTIFAGAYSLTLDTLSTQAGGDGLGTDPLVLIPLILTTNTGTFMLALPAVRLLITGTTTLHLVARATFSAGTVAAYGTLRARRAG